MKKITKTIAAILSGALMLSSCSTTSKMTLTAPINATIVNPQNETLGVSNTGHVQLEVIDKTYYPYLIAQDAATGLSVPFGIDVHRNKYMGEKMAFGAGIGFAGAGLFANFVGLIMLIATGDDDDLLNTELGFICGGLGADLIGLGLVAPSEQRLQQTMHHYEMAYNKKQSVSFEGLSTKLINPDAPKDAQNASMQTTKKRRATSSSDNVKENANDATTAVAKRNRNDHGAKVAGTYIGKGTLYKGKDVDEEYSEVKVVITRIDKTHVAVQVIEGGEDFFTSPLEYVIESTVAKGYKLSIDGTPSATITIDNRGFMRFDHKKVNIDGELFSLSLTGKRK